MAFVTGLWRHVSRFKAPHLRGVASRAPYFHNGMAATLADVVEHYDTIRAPARRGRVPGLASATKTSLLETPGSSLT